MSDRVAKSRNRKAIAALAAICAGAVILYWGVCSVGSSRSLTIHFILPESFMGRITVHEDPIHGDSVVGGNQDYTIRVPASGHTTIKDTSIFEDWHKLTARRESGTPVGTIHRPTGDSDVALREMGWSSEYGMVLFLGSYEAFVKEQQRLRFSN